MFLVKVLEKKGVIQTFGLALVLAPIVNTLVKMAMLSNLPNRWSFAMFWRIIAVGSVPNQLLYMATIIIGILMLRGTTTVWKYALMLLGGYILLQISDFKHVKSSAVTWMFFITNILTFMFVADQLVWKVKAAAPKKKPSPNKDFVAPKAPASAVAVAQPVTAKPASSPPLQPTAEPKPVEQTKTVTLASLQEAAKAAAKAAPQPAPVQATTPVPAVKAVAKPAYRVIPKVRKKILFQFAGGGPWGQLVGISSQGIHVRGLSEPPADIATREIEISLNNGLTLRTRLARRKEHDYYFDYTSLSSEEIKSLNKWLHSLSDAA